MIGIVGLVATESLAQGIPDAEAPTEDETAVYVVRKKARVGAVGRKVWVGVNKNVYANLASGAHCFFKIPAGVNSLNLVQDRIPMLYTSLDNRGGETVYLHYFYGRGELTEVSEAEGKALLRGSRRMKDIGELRPNDGHSQALLNPGYVKLDLMKSTDAEVEPDAEHAAITFIRAPGAKVVDRIFSFGVWGEDGFLGDLAGETAFTVKVPAGEHMFFALSEDWYVIKAEVEAGKSYYVELVARRGRTRARLEFRPAGGGAEAALARARRVTLDESAITDDVRMRLDAALPLLAETRDGVLKGRIAALSLRPSHAR